MRLLQSLLTFAALFAGILIANPLNAQLLSPPVGQWEVQAGFRALDRPDFDGVNSPIFIDGGTGATLLDVKTATDLNIGLGPDISFSSLRENGLDYEVRFFFSNFERTTLTQGDDITSSFFPGTSFREVNGRYESDMFNIELNQKRIFNPYVRLLHGVRFFHIQEEFRFDGEGLLIVPFTGSNVTKAKNPMLGYHFGAESSVAVIPGLDVDTYFKMGLFSNFASQSSTVTNSFATAATITSGSEAQAAFVSDFGIKFHFNVVENFMSFYGGYDGMYVTGYAPAPANVGVASGAVNDMDFWLHGIVFGMAIRR